MSHCAEKRDIYQQNFHFLCERNSTHLPAKSHLGFSISPASHKLVTKDTATKMNKSLLFPKQREIKGFTLQ